MGSDARRRRDDDMGGLAPEQDAGGPRGCTGHGHGPEDQRGNSEKAQGEKEAHGRHDGTGNEVFFIPESYEGRARRFPVAVRAPGLLWR